jgi:hypothetical protein
MSTALRARTFTPEVLSMRRILTLAVLPTLLLAAAALAQVPSGPSTGEKIEPLRVFDATGPNKDKELDYAAERKDRPTVYVFIREWDRPVARFLKVLDGALNSEGGDAATVAVWLTDDKAGTKEYLPRAQQSLQMQKTAFTVFLGDRLGPDGWSINPNAFVTVVVAAKGKTAASFGYNSINDTDVRRVHQELKKAASGE